MFRKRSNEQTISLPNQLDEVRNLNTDMEAWSRMAESELMTWKTMNKYAERDSQLSAQVGGTHKKSENEYDAGREVHKTESQEPEAQQRTGRKSQGARGGTGRLAHKVRDFEEGVGPTERQSWCGRLPRINSQGSAAVLHTGRID
jgi:hypothetical protein